MQSNRNKGARNGKGAPSSSGSNRRHSLRLAAGNEKSPLPAEERERIMIGHHQGKWGMAAKETTRKSILPFMNG